MKKNLKYLLRDKLTAKELRMVPSAFDIVGDIMIFADFPKELEGYEEVIGKSILESYKHVKVVLKKTKYYSGRFRLPKLRFIAGERRKETIHRENNILIKLNVEKVYFSPRLGSERKRVAELVKPNELVLVMFSGCAPYPLVIARNSGCKEIYGIEINPAAHNYAVENVRINRLENRIKLFLGDVRRIVPKLKKRFDRILMPLPKGGETYLDVAIKSVKKGGTIYFYDFENEKEFGLAFEKVNNACAAAGKKCRMLEMVKCGQYSPGMYRICVDFKVI